MTSARVLVMNRVEEGSQSFGSQTVVRSARLLVLDKISQFIRNRRGIFRPPLSLCDTPVVEAGADSEHAEV
jgi:hypothetical protein